MRILSLISSKYLWCSVFAVISFTVAYFVEAYFQAVMLALGAAFLGIILELVPHPLETKWIPKHLYSALPVISIFVAFIIGWYIGYPLPNPYPREDGLIANFTTGSGGAARNIFGETFGVILDSDINQNSKGWYKCICDEDGTGYLRLYYQFLPQNSQTPYVGVHTNFCRPPAKALEISNFKKITLKIRCSQQVNPSDLNVFISLPTANVQGAGFYDYYEYQIPWHELQTTWVKIDVPFEKMRIPSWSNRQYRLNLKQVFQLNIAIKGKPGLQQHGYIDIDEIKFER